ncbi:hypothetical protein ACVWWN_008276 [Mycobacterium sp. URHB0021]
MSIHQPVLAARGDHDYTPSTTASCCSPSPNLFIVRQSPNGHGLPRHSGHRRGPGLLHAATGKAHRNDDGDPRDHGNSTGL